MYVLLRDPVHVLGNRKECTKTLISSGTYRSLRHLMFQTHNANCTSLVRILLSATSSLWNWSGTSPYSAFLESQVWMNRMNASLAFCETDVSEQKSQLYAFARNSH
jgi:hypothetical protein